MKLSRLLGLCAVFALPIAMGAQCGGEPVQQCQDSEGRLVACPSDDAGAVIIHHDAGPRPDAGSADTGRNLAFGAACTPGEQGGCRFACLDTPAGWPGEGSGGFCTKPCANHAECGDENHWRCAEVAAEGRWQPSNSLAAYVDEVGLAFLPDAEETTTPGTSEDASSGDESAAPSSPFDED